MSDDAKLKSAYGLVLANEVESIFSLAQTRGIGATINSIVEIFNRIGQLDPNHTFLNDLVPQLNLYGSMVSTLVDRLVTTASAYDIVAALEIDEGSRKSLYLHLRSIRLTSINGRQGHMIEKKLLIEEIPALEEFSAEVVDPLIRALRDRHQRVLFSDVPSEESQFFTEFVKALRASDFEAAERALHVECRRLDERIVELQTQK